MLGAKWPKSQVPVAPPVVSPPVLLTSTSTTNLAVGPASKDAPDGETVARLSKSAKPEAASIPHAHHTSHVYRSNVSCHKHGPVQRDTQHAQIDNILDKEQEAFRKEVVKHLNSARKGFAHYSITSMKPA